MPNQTKYVKIRVGPPQTGWPAGSDIFYKCEICGDIIPSLPDGSVLCSCRNMWLDVDYGRFGGKDEEKIAIPQNRGSIPK